MFGLFFRPMSGDIPLKYGRIWYSTSILGSWNSHSYNGINHLPAVVKKFDHTYDSCSYSYMKFSVVIATVIQ